MQNGITKGLSFLQTVIKKLAALLHNHPQILVRLLTILIIESVVCISFLAILHNPHLDFDEANTLSTARLDIASIHQLLANDQNFPLYYDWLHLFSQVVGSVDKAGLITNILVWLISCWLYYQLLKLLLKNRLWALFFTLMYIHTSSISFYAGYIRMYGVFDLLLLCFFYTFIRYTKNANVAWLILTLGTILGLILLHPIALLILPPVILILWKFVRNFKQRLLTMLSLASISWVFFTQIATKTNPYQVYITQGRSYLTFVNTTLFDLPANLFFSLHNPIHDPITSIFFVIFLYCIYLVIKHKLWRIQHTLPFIIFCLEFLCLNLLFPTQFNVHHLTFFAIPALVVFAILCSTIPRHKALLLISTILFCAIPLTMKNYRTMLITASMVNKFCQGMQTARGLTMITDYATYDAISYCLGNEKLDIIFVQKNGLVITKTLSFQQILKAQGNAYGLPPLILERAYTIKKTLSPLKPMLLKKPNPQKLAYIKITYDEPYLFPDEIKTFSAYTLTTYTYPGVYIFTQQ